MIEEPQEVQALFAGVDILKGLPRGETEYLAARSTIVRLGRKENLDLGGYHRGILLLLRGRVRVHEPTLGGQELTFSVIEGGSVVVQPGPTPGTSRASRVEALEASVLGALGWEDFERLVLRNPKVGLETIGLLGERLDEYEGRLSDLIRKEVLARLAGVLLRLSSDDARTGNGDRRIPASYTHQQLASMVGSNREAVTRAFGLLRKAGAVKTVNRQIHVTDAAALESFAGVVR